MHLKFSTYFSKIEKTVNGDREIGTCTHEIHMTKVRNLIVLLEKVGRYTKEELRTRLYKSRYSHSKKQIKVNNFQACHTLAITYHVENEMTCIPFLSQCGSTRRKTWCRLPHSLYFSCNDQPNISHWAELHYELRTTTILFASLHSQCAIHLYFVVWKQTKQNKSGVIACCYSWWVDSYEEWWCWYVYLWPKLMYTRRRKRIYVLQ